MRTTLLWTTGLVRSVGSARVRALARDDRGEGVISAAIAVLIMAFLGAAMWIGFQQMWKTTERTTNDKVEQIGSD
ncbi:MAG: hypothetical protein ACXWCM_16125 [Acidimicrobiales bacterium]